MMKNKTPIEKPRLVESDEWLYKGCFIQKQIHPKLLPFFVFKNTKQQEKVGVCYTFKEAKKLCEANEVKSQYLKL